MGNPIKVEYIGRENTGRKVNPYKNDMPYMAYGGSTISPDKALAFLQDGTIYGKPLTEKQRQAFAMAAGVDLDEEGMPIMDDVVDEEDRDSQEEFRYGGQRSLPNKGTRKNIKTSMNSVMRRNEVLYGPSGRRFYSQYYKEQGGDSMQTPPTAAQFFNYGNPTADELFYKRGGQWNTNELAFPQQPPANVFFAGANWQSQYKQGGQPCMKCGGMHDGGSHMMPDGSMMLDEDMPGENGYKKGGQKNWIQGAVNPAHKGYCTPMTKPTCTGKRRAFAETMKKHHGFHKKALGGDTNIPGLDQDAYLQNRSAKFMDFVNDNNMNAMLNEDLNQLDPDTAQMAEMMMARGGIMPFLGNGGGTGPIKNMNVPEVTLSPQDSIYYTKELAKGMYDPNKYSYRAVDNSGKGTKRRPVDDQVFKTIKATGKEIEVPPAMWNPAVMKEVIRRQQLAQGQEPTYAPLFWPATNPSASAAPVKKYGGSMGLKKFFPGGNVDDCTDEEKMDPKSPCYDPAFVPGANSDDLERIWAQRAGQTVPSQGAPGTQTQSNNRAPQTIDLPPNPNLQTDTSNAPQAPFVQTYQMDPNQMSQGQTTQPPTDNANGAVMFKKKQPMNFNGEAAANWLISGINTAASMFEMRDRKKQEEWMKTQQGADAQFYNQSAGDRGTYDQFGNFRPNSMVPIQQSGNPYGQMGSMYAGFKEGGEYYLNDDEVDYILKNGGQIEYLD